MTRIAHLTDLHFGADDPPVVAALLDELNADPPDLVAISGDLTQGARRREFAAAGAFIGQLRAPVLAVPGNHDITPYDLWQRFSDPYARWRDAIGPETEPAWQDSEVAVLGLNTARRIGLHWDWSHGRVTRPRLRRLVAKLDALPEHLVRVVVAHHPLLAPEAAPQTRVVGGASAALAAFARHRVTLVLAGHLHRGYARLTAPQGGTLVLQGATATSVRLRGEPNAYNRVTLGADGQPLVVVRVWDGRNWTTRAAARPDAGEPDLPPPSLGRLEAQL